MEAMESDKVAYEKGFEAGKKEGYRLVVDYLFFKDGIIGLMGCSTFEEVKSKLLNGQSIWQSILKRYGLDGLK